MSKPLSLYLDLCRALAAFTVVLHHFRDDQFSGGYISWFSYGNDAVMVFFVLSGFVIGYVSETKERSKEVFLYKRLSRLWSVLVPAVLFAVVADILYTRFYLHTGTDWSGLLNTAKNSILFNNETWTVQNRFETNKALWSLAYEFWYYIFFLLLFMVNKPAKWLFFLVVVLFTGYKIVLLFPIWLLGYLIFRYRHKIKWAPATARYGFFVSLILLLALLIIGQSFESGFRISYLFTETYPLHNSKQLIYQYMIGFAVFLHLYFAVQHLSARSHPPAFLAFFEKPIRFCASISFAVYCFHESIYYLVKGIFKYDVYNKVHVAGAFALSMLVLITICVIVERWKGFPLSKEKIYSFLAR
jgi:peptidoglycan/LPS O-acetylase OafA/YrhL